MSSIASKKCLLLKRYLNIAYFLNKENDLSTAISPSEPDIIWDTSASENLEKSMLKHSLIIEEIFLSVSYRALKSKL